MKVYVLSVKMLLCLAISTVTLFGAEVYNQYLGNTTNVVLAPGETLVGVDVGFFFSDKGTEYYTYQPLNATQLQQVEDAIQKAFAQKKPAMLTYSFQASAQGNTASQDNLEYVVNVVSGGTSLLTAPITIPIESYFSMSGTAIQGPVTTEALITEASFGYKSSGDPDNAVMLTGVTGITFTTAGIINPSLTPSVPVIDLPGDDMASLTFLPGFEDEDSPGKNIYASFDLPASQFTQLTTSLAHTKKMLLLTVDPKVNSTNGYDVDISVYTIDPTLPPQQVFTYTQTGIQDVASNTAIPSTYKFVRLGLTGKSNNQSFGNNIIGYGISSVLFKANSFSVTPALNFSGLEEVINDGANKMVYLSRQQAVAPTTTLMIPGTNLTQFWFSPVFETGEYCELPLQTSATKMKNLNDALAAGVVSVNFSTQKQGSNLVAIATFYQNGAVLFSHDFGPMKNSDPANEGAVIPHNAIMIGLNMTYQTSRMNTEVVKGLGNVNNFLVVSDPAGAVSNSQVKVAAGESLDQLGIGFEFTNNGQKEVAVVEIAGNYLQEVNAQLNSGKNVVLSGSLHKGATDYTATITAQVGTANLFSVPTTTLQTVSAAVSHTSPTSHHNVNHNVHHGAVHHNVHHQGGTTGQALANSIVAKSPTNRMAMVNALKSAISGGTITKAQAQAAIESKADLSPRFKNIAKNEV